jgi:hypothetical protein
MSRQQRYRQQCMGDHVVGLSGWAFAARASSQIQDHRSAAIGAGGGMGIADRIQADTASMLLPVKQLIRTSPIAD